MIEVAHEADGQPTAVRRSRFHFGLKTLFVVITISCLLLGWRAVRQKKAAAIVARSHAVLDVIEKNLATAPENTTFVMPAAIRQQSAQLLRPRRPDPVHQRAEVSRIGGSGRFYCRATRGESLDITGLSALYPPDDAAMARTHVRAHYERGLAEVGLQRRLGGGKESAAAIWEMPEHGLSVSIEVEIDAGQKRAEVRILYVHEETLSMW